MQQQIKENIIGCDNMTNIKLLEQVAAQQIEEIEKRQIEYKNNNIILVDTFLDELYNELHFKQGVDDKQIAKLLKTKKIWPAYDNKLGFFKIILVNILNDSNYNLSVLRDDLKINYAWIVNTMIDAIKKEALN
jgi:hypothetical protein